MDIFFSYQIYYFVPFSVSIATIIFLLAFRFKYSSAKLPPGRKGWPVIGESLEFRNAERFVKDRMNKHSQKVFRTSLVGENMVVICGAAGNKFLFSNMDKLVTSWWPNFAKKIMYFPTLTTGNNLMKPPSALHEFLKPELIKQYVKIMDILGSKHIDMNWASNINQEVKVYPLSKKYTFDLSCRLFMNIQDPISIAKISDGFDRIFAGFVSLPVDLPGTTFNSAIKASNILHRELMEIIKRRKKELEDKREDDAVADDQDLLSHMLVVPDENGKFRSEPEISTYMIGVLMASHETTSTAITFILKYLAQLPHVYDAVFKEHMEIAKSKGPKENLNWNNIQKMKYSWNVARESMRLSPPSLGAFGEVLADFTYAGFTIPKGWKTHWNVHSTHKNPEYFPDPEKFDPSRFEGNGPPPYTYVPFGGGPHMCLGREYARMEILVFIHNVVTRFKLEIVNPNEKITYNPTPIPANGLPILLHPHQI